MITLDTPHTTTVQYLAGDKVVSAVVTDTLCVKEVRLDFSTGAMYANIARGTIVDGVFGSNYPSLDIVVNPDGSFSSTDGITWVGKLDAASQLIEQLRTVFDSFILGSGKVTGKMYVAPVPDPVVIVQPSSIDTIPVDIP